MFTRISLNDNVLSEIVESTQVKLSDLKDKIIMVTSWHLELLANNGDENLAPRDNLTV